MEGFHNIKEEMVLKCDLDNKVNSGWELDKKIKQETGPQNKQYTLNNKFYSIRQETGSQT